MQSIGPNILILKFSYFLKDPEIKSTFDHLPFLITLKQIMFTLFHALSSKLLGNVSVQRN
jgi:hypothetical protein